MVFLSVHAAQRALERGITHAEITEAIDHPETTYRSDEDEDVLVFLGVTGQGRRLKVCVPVTDRGYVITVSDRDDER